VLKLLSHRRPCVVKFIENLVIMLNLSMLGINYVDTRYLSSLWSVWVLLLGPQSLLFSEYWGAFGGEVARTVK